MVTPTGENCGPCPRKLGVVNFVSDHLGWMDEIKKTCGCFRKWWYPQIIHFNRVFHYKPSILGYHYFWKHPCGHFFVALFDCNLSGHGLWGLIL